MGHEVTGLLPVNGAKQTIKSEGPVSKKIVVMKSQ